jgi:hypothetical protein
MLKRLIRKDQWTGLEGRLKKQEQGGIQGFKPGLKDRKTL